MYLLTHIDIYGVTPFLGPTVDPRPLSHSLSLTHTHTYTHTHTHFRACELVWGCQEKGKIFSKQVSALFDQAHARAHVCVHPSLSLSLSLYSLPSHSFCLSLGGRLYRTALTDTKPIKRAP